MTSRARGALGVSLLIGILSNPSIANEKVTSWRLFVSNHERGVVSVIDAEKRASIASFGIDGPASLFRSASGELVFAVQGAANRVATIQSGIVFRDHGDHADIEVTDPRLLSIAFDGPKPSHFVEHDGEIAIFFDGSGKAVTTSERRIPGGSAESREFDSGAPHHGAAAVFAGHVLITVPNSEKPSSLPVGIQVRRMSGEAVGAVHPCPDVHGEASTGNIMAFACSTGLVIIQPQNDAPSLRHLPYSGLPAGKVTTLIGGRGLQYFLGNFGPRGVVLIEPTEATAFRHIELPTRRVHFAVDPIQAKFAYVVTEDGKLHQIDVLNGSIVRSILLTAPYSMDGHWSDPRPRLAVAGENIVVTDPLAGKLHLVNRDSFQRVGEIAVPGKPFNIIAIGGTGVVHN